MSLNTTQVAFADETGSLQISNAVPLQTLNHRVLFPTRQGSTRYATGTVQVRGNGSWSAARVTPILSNDPSGCEYVVHPDATALSPSAPSSIGLKLTHAYFVYAVTTAESAACLGDVFVNMSPTPPTGATGAAGATGATGSTGAAGPQNVLAKVMSADQSINSSTTLTNVTDLVFAIGASETWVYRFSINAGDALYTTGVKVAATIPTGATMSLYMGYGDDGNNSATLNVARSTASGVAADSGAVPFATPQILIDLTVVNSTTAGNVQLQFAQSTSDGTDLTFKAKSSGVGTKI